jgi:signal transduction histidine kinase
MADPPDDARPQGAAQRRADAVFRVALIGIAGGCLLTSIAALAVPPLAALAPRMAEPVRLFAVVLGAVVALAVAALGPSGEPPGTRLGTRIGAIVAIGGSGTSVAGGLLALGLARPLGLPFDRSGLVAIVAGDVGFTLVVAMLCAVAASHIGLREGAPSSGVPLRLLVGGSTLTLTMATWALATSYLVGHLEAESRQARVAEADDLVRLLAELPAAEQERLAPQLAPPGGFLVRADAAGALVPGLVVGLPRDARLSLDEGPSCRLSGRPRAFPCAATPLSEGTRLVAGTSDVSLPFSLLLGFVLVGVVAAAGAFATGAWLGGGPAEDLARVAGVLDGLGGAGPGGLDHPIPAVSLDEVGDLAVALARLRVRLRPGLVEHDEALARARAADQERDQFLTLVSEELRAPLDRILGSSRLLLEGEEPLSLAQREDMRLIVSSSTHLIELIEEVLDLSAIATGRINLRRADVDVSQIVADVARAQRPLLGARKIELRLDLPEAPVRAFADERRLRQVVTNLVSNAVKFTREGAITLSVKRDDRGCTIAIADTGPGIPPEQLPRLFAEFVQLGTLRERARGTGLGLAICKRLIDAHGGTIRADSVVERGSTFTVHLPDGGTE